MKTKKIKRKILFRIDSVLLVFQNWWNKHYNDFTIGHFIDPKEIPIIIINFNQLGSLKRLVEFLIKKGHKSIFIIDNFSTFPPLLEYYNKNKLLFEVIRLDKNYGHLVLWKRREILRRFENGYYVVTDPDILPVEECPPDFIANFKKILDSNNRVNKVGFSLKVDDIPDYYPLKEKVIKWETRFWNDKTKGGDYWGGIDTTFALYRPKRLKLIKPNFLDAIRTKSPYIARHLSWYIDPKFVTEEQAFYSQVSNDSNSWKIDKYGNPENEFYR